MIQNIVLLGMLVVSAYKDWKEKTVYLYILFLAGIMGLILHLVYHDRSITDLLAGALVGAIMIFAAWVSKESIGTGDGAMLIVSGIYLGFWKNLMLVVIALFLAGGAAIFFLFIMRKERNYRIPFLPFLLVAYLLILL